MIRARRLRDLMLASPPEPTRKVEGVHARADGRAIELLLVTDAAADDDVPAAFLPATLP